VNTLGRIVCKTAGIAGMSAVLYDAYSVGSANTKRYSQKIEADHFEKVHAETRTLENESRVGQALQGKVAKFRSNNPLVSLYGKIAGFASGFFSSLGDNLIPTAFASLALAGKGFWAKAGAWGLAASGVYIIAKEGFGFGKHTSAD